jgi:hypothetical protein
VTILELRDAIHKSKARIKGVNIATTTTANQPRGRDAATMRAERAQEANRSEVSLLARITGNKKYERRRAMKMYTQA